MVIFRSADGKPGYHQAETLEEAVGFVERLRNEDQVGDARVFRMDEVPIEFKVYYRVEVAGAPVAEATPAAAGDAVADDAGEATPAEAAEGNGAGNPGRFGLFARS
jgi:hypothetical protein